MNTELHNRLLTLKNKNSQDPKINEYKREIREALDQLEGNRAPDVIDIESNGG